MIYQFPTNIFKWENGLKTMPYLVDAIRQVNGLCIKSPENHMNYINDFYNQLLDAHDENCDLYSTLCRIYSATSDDYIQTDNKIYLDKISIIVGWYRQDAQKESVAEVKNNFTTDIPFDKVFGSIY